MKLYSIRGVAKNDEFLPTRCEAVRTAEQYAKTWSGVRVYECTMADFNKTLLCRAANKEDIVISRRQIWPLEEKANV